MIVGILETDNLDDDILRHYGSYSDMFTQLLKSVDNKIEIKTYKVIDQQYPDRFDECNAYLITGSKFNAYANEPWILKLQSFIVSLFNNEIKIIGICFGHQIVARALGGRVEKSDNGWGIGQIKSHVIRKENWMIPQVSKLSLLVSHQDQVVTLPESAESIITNDLCSFAGFVMGNQVLTFQGHPEFSVDYLKFIMKNRRDSIGQENYITGLQSLNNKVDDSIVAKWMVNFLLADIES